MASDYLLVIEGIKGESKDDVKKESIEIMSWSWGASNPTSVGSGGLSAGKVNFSDFNFMYAFEKSSPEFLNFCASGEHIPKAVLYGRKSGDKGKRLDYLTVTFEDILVSSVQTSASDGGGIPTVSIGFSWAKYKLEYAEQNAKGALEAPVIATYDVKAAKK